MFFTHFSVLAVKRECKYVTVSTMKRPRLVMKSCKLFPNRLNLFSLIGYRLTRPSKPVFLYQGADLICLKFFEVYSF